MRIAADRRHSAAGIGSHDPARRQKQICIRLAAPAPDSAPELMQFRKTEHIRTLDDHGIGIRDIDPGFNDRGADQNIDFTLDKKSHD